MKLIRISYVIAVLGMSSAYFTLAPTPNSKLVLYNGMGLLALLMTLVGIRVNKPTYRTPWLLFAGGQASFLVADVIYYLLEKQSESVPFPSVADAFYLGMYPLVIVGLALKIRYSVQGRRDWAGLIDAGIFGIALFSVLWVLVMDTYVPASGQGTGERLISLAYPVADLAVLFVAIRLAVTFHRRTNALIFIIAALGSLVIADIQYGVLNAADAFKTGSIVDAFWIGFYTLFALGALDPSMSKSVATGANQLERISRARLALMFVATLTVPVIDLFWGTQEDKVVTLTASAVLFALMLSRVLGLVRSVEYGRELLRREARHDPLTGLANRTMFAEKTEAVLSRSRENVAVLLIDLDDFKAVNDSLGHAAGDEVLVTAAERIRRCVRENDVVARLGGDEFAVLLTKTIDSQDAANTAARILKALAEPTIVMDRSVRIGGSVGVAMQSAENSDVQTLLRSADVAMYLAKRQGKNRFEFFEQSHYAEVVDRINLKTDLENALSRHEFEVYYQPIVDTDTAIIRSVEALLRWNHPTRGMISPSIFIPLAEEMGAINEIGSWVLAETCRQVREWQLTVPHCGELRASVNLSALQLHDTELLHRITDALRASGLAPGDLTLEVTESLLVADSTSSTRTLEQLTALKVRVAIDDFGTGYSSLSYLHSFPVDTIKIDQSFVQKLDDSVTSHALIRTVIDLARAVGGITVAEGVENQRQLDILSALKCDLVQGFLFSRPIPAGAFGDLLRRRNAAEQLLPLPGKARRAQVIAAGQQAEVLSGLRQLEPILQELEEFHRTVGAPVTARWPWLSSWFHLHPDNDIRCVVVRSTESSKIEGAAILATTQNANRTKISTISDQMASVASVFAHDEKSALQLANGIADLVQNSPGFWDLELNQIAGKNVVTAALERVLPNVVVEGALPVPRVLLLSDLDLGRLLSKNMRKQLRRGRSRLDSETSNWKVDFHRGTDAIMALLPEIEETHIGRDHDRRSESDLDNAVSRRFWQETIVAHTYSDELEIATLTVDGAIAAYVVSLVDGASYRVFDGRMSSQFAKFSPGRVLETATLQRAMSDPQFEIFDWMTGVAPETILAANDWETRTLLTASAPAGSTKPKHSDSTGDTNSSWPTRRDALRKSNEVSKDLVRTR